ncbi:MAG: DUF3108 domain-containing protein [Rubritepida sp.]|jgi:hypothetical protein|nr:DUF3108 domain-containing protein [Rubritepida sp.]
MFRALLLPLLILAAPAAAEGWRATYTITAAGLPVLDAELRFNLDGPAYEVESRVQTRGLARLVMGGEQVARSRGAWQGSEPRPAVHESEGVWRGAPRRTHLEYGRDGNPRIVRLEPAEDMPRTPVPPEARPGTIDTLSALLLLARRVRDTERCDARTRGFDGRRLTQFDVVGEPPASAAEAGLLRCVIESRALAGYALDRDPEEARAPLRTVALFGRIAPDAPPVPLRVELASRWWGRIEARLTGLSRL